MNTLIPWVKLEKKLARHYPKGENGRPPYPLNTMLRVHAMQLFYNLSDPAMEDALYEIESMRQFAGLRLSERLPDETTILNFRHFLEQHKLGKKIFETINQHLSEQGLMLREGSIVDASILSAPSSTKNQSSERAERKVEWLIAMRPGKRAKLSASNPLAQAERIKASVRVKVEHSFFYIKRVLGYSKVRYRGLAKNTNRLHVLAAFSNLMMARNYLPTQGWCACHLPKGR